MQTLSKDPGTYTTNFDSNNEVSGLIKENPYIGKGEVFSLAGKREISNQCEDTNDKTELENIGLLVDVTSISNPLSTRKCSSIGEVSKFPNPEQDLHCGWNIYSSANDEVINNAKGRGDILGDDILVNGKCISDPLRLTGGGDASSECEENANIEYQGNSLISISSSPPIRDVSEFGMVSVIGDLDHPSGHVRGTASLDTSEISIGSIPLLEQTPLILDDETPNLSQDMIVDESENLDNFGANRMISIQGILHEAGYTSLEIENMSSNCTKKCDDGNYGRSRPHTQVFYQGKTFSYEKLEVDCPGGNKSKFTLQKGHSSINMCVPTLPEFKYPATNLNPEAQPFISNSPIIDSAQANNPIKLSPDALTALKNIRVNNLKNVIIGQLNINSLRNKFSSLSELIHGNIDILVITETKLDHTFPEKQFLIPG